MSNLKPLLQSSTKQVCARTKRVLVIGGLDPSGAAGVVADINTLSRVNSRAAVLLSTQTAQGLSSWGESREIDPAFFRSQVAQLQDGPAWEAVKVGAIGSAEMATEIQTLLLQLRAQQPDLPIVIDPVLHSSSGGTLAEANWFQSLLALATICCPNQAEHHALQTQCTSTAAHTLITDQNPGAVLYSADNEPVPFTYTRRPGNWRGTGCRLSSLIAAGLAAGLSVRESCAWALGTLHTWIDNAASAPQHSTAALFP